MIARNYSHYFTEAQARNKPKNKAAATAVISHMSKKTNHVTAYLHPKNKHTSKLKLNQTLWPESASELYGQSDRRSSAKLVPTFADRRCHVVRVTDPYGRILGFLDRSCYFFFLVAPQLYSRGWVDPVPELLLLRKSGSAGNGTRTSGH
jgi:hypothetical protein